MNIFLISFDIFPPSLLLQHGIIVNAIKSFGYWAKPTTAVWLIKTFYSKDYVMDRLRASAGPTDRILVMSVNKDWIALHLPNDVINWMQSNI